MSDHSQSNNKPISLGRGAIQWVSRLLPLAVVCLCGAIFVYSGIRLDDVTQRLRGTGAWAPFLFGLVGVIAMSIMVPKTWISVAAGALLGTTVGCFTMLLAAMAAASLNYFIGLLWVHRTGGPTPTETLIVPGEEVSLRSTIILLAREAGFGIHLLIRLAPLPTCIVSYSMGAASARFLPYLIAAGAAVIPQCFYIHAAAIATSDNNDSPYKQVSFYFSIAVILFVVIALPRIVLKRLNETREQNQQIAGR